MSKQTIRDMIKTGTYKPNTTRDMGGYAVTDFYNKPKTHKAPLKSERERVIEEIEKLFFVSICKGYGKEYLAISVKKIDWLKLKRRLR